MIFPNLLLAYETNMEILKLEEYILAKDFESIVKKTLEKNGFRIIWEDDKNFDFEAEIHNYSFNIEVKLYRNKLPDPDLLRKASRKLISQNSDASKKSILIVSSFVTPSLKKEILQQYHVKVWDIVNLLALSFDFSDTYYELEFILTKALKDSIDEYRNIDVTFKSNIINDLLNSTSSLQPLIINADNTGITLWNELNELLPGTNDATKYENRCIKILEFLFRNTKEPNLTLWKKQLTTDDGLNRNDLLCKISYGNRFWTELAGDFNTRYIVFEFKNYTDPIGQREIFTTEKYLFLTALRSVSFIIARRGASENAIKAAKGALKEAGKLIVILDNNDLKEMVELKDKGSEPHSVLEKRIDELLITLNR
jgi:hypothetical protein